MKTLPVLQGSPEWHAARTAPGVRTASDAPAMMGLSKYKSRADLIREKFTGITEVVDAAKQALFDAGHAAEAAARPLAEAILGEDLMPTTVITDDGRFLASLDGETMVGDTIFEHKLWNESIAAEVRAGRVPESHLCQIDHQFMVHTLSRRCLFMVSDGTPERCVHCFVFRDESRIAKIREGWEQFDRDLAGYAPAPEVAKPVAAPVDGFGVLSLRIEGKVLSSNLDAFKAGADAFIARLPKASELQTDQDFADAEEAVKACAEAEDMIDASKRHAQAQMTDIDAVFVMADNVRQTIRAARLALSKVVEAEKANRRAQAVADGVESVRLHYVELNKALGDHAIGMPGSTTADIGGSIKGLRSLSSIRERVDSVAMQMKVAATLQANRIQSNMALIAEFRASGCGHLIPDAIRICAEKTTDDLRNLLESRHAKHKADEDARLEAERQRIRAEEQTKAEREARERIAGEERQRAELERIEREQQSKVGAEFVDAIEAAEPSKPDASATIPAAPADASTVQSAPAGDAADSRMISLGSINDLIAPLSISQKGLEHFGLVPVGNMRRSVMYRVVEVPRAFAAMADHLRNMAMEVKGV